jgi:hypothetical protein
MAKAKTKITAKVVAGKATKATAKTAVKPKAASLDNEIYQAKVASYTQRRIMHGATGRQPARTLCGYLIAAKDKSMVFDGEVENPCQRCVKIVENRVVHDW